MVFIHAKREWKHGHEENAKALNVQTPFDISEQSLLSALVYALFIQETKVRLERREIRESWGRMDVRDFQVTISTAHDGRTENEVHTTVPDDL